MASWLFFALLSAVFASLTAMLAKLAVTGVNSNLATAIRTCFVLVFAWGIAFWRGDTAGLASLTPRSWLLLALSGVATGASWLAYFRALQLGAVSRVAPIDKLSVALTVLLAFVLLGEKPTTGSLAGAALITAGVLVSALVP